MHDGLADSRADEAFHQVTLPVFAAPVCFILKNKVFDFESFVKENSALWKDNDDASQVPRFAVSKSAPKAAQPCFLDIRKLRCWRRASFIALRLIASTQKVVVGSLQIKKSSNRYFASLHLSRDVS